MHVYASTPDIRFKLSYIIVGIGIGVAIIINSFARIPWQVDVLGPSSLAGLIWWSFDRWVWKWHWGEHSLSKCPDFSGLWTGTVYVDNSPAPVGMKILQSWTGFYLVSNTPNSRTRSLMAATFESDGEVRYEFVNEQKTAATQASRGLGVLRFSGKDTLSGDFFLHDKSGTLALRRWSGTTEGFDIEHNWDLHGEQEAS